MRFKIVQGEGLLSSHSGLALVGEMLNTVKLRQRLNKVVLTDHPTPEIPHGDVAAAMIGLICVGKPDFDAIELFRDDPFFSTCLGVDRVPSSPTLRQRLDGAQGVFNDILLETSAEMVKRFAPAITPCHEELVPVDIDVSPFDNSDTKKEGVEWTYKRFNGYSPVFAYVGLEGYLAHLQLRPGNGHCQNGMETFLEETLDNARRMTAAPFLVRMDAGNDSLDNIQVCREKKAHYLIKRNLRKESKQEWLQTAQACGQMSTPRLGKQVWQGDCYRNREGTNDPLRIVFRVTQRTIEADGQALLVPDVEVETYWTSLDADAEKVIQLYHAHGSSEQFHSELKTDLDLERLPSGKFQTNELVLLLGMVAYNVLRMIGQKGLQGNDAPLRERPFRRRIRSVMQDMIYLACRMVKHARQYTLSFGRHCPWFDTWRRVYLCLPSAAP
jgi:hypothetical protein